MTVRPAATGDVQALLPLVARYWELEGISGFNPPRIGQLLNALIASQALGAVWVAESAGTLTGYLIVVWVLSFEHQGLMAEIDELFVSQSARSQGTGAALVAAAESWLKRRGAVRVQLQLGTTNLRARGFYQRHGYTARAGYELWDKPL
jgi:GNAT superfamily N-acetyltransferase